MRNTLAIGVMGVLLCCGGLAQSEPITIQIWGNITSLGGYTEVIPSSIHAGITFTGTYTYDSLASDSGGGHYVYNAPYGMDLFLGGYEFKTAPDQVGKFHMWIVNDLSSNGVWDYYSICGYQNVSTPSVNFASSTGWVLGDSTHTALSSNALPVRAPILTDWNHNVLSIEGSYGPDLYGVSIYGTVTQVQLIPEPVTGILMAMGVLFLRRRR
jgi:hypothetical protein